MVPTREKVFIAAMTPLAVLYLAWAWGLVG